jgi:hypothetical protein
MDMIDRIMKAFVRQRPLTVEQEAMVRAEVAKFAHGPLNDHKKALAPVKASIDKHD